MHLTPQRQRAILKVTLKPAGPAQVALRAEGSVGMRSLTRRFAFVLTLCLGTTALSVGIYNPDFSEGLSGWTTYGQVSDGTEYYDPDIVRTDGGYVRLDLGAVMDQIGDTDVLIAFDLLGAIDGFATQVRIDNVTLIPEPATLALLALGALGILHRRRRPR